MEFLRFGSSIPGGYWGCCAVSIIQNFKFDPLAKASIELVSGDGGNPILNSKGEKQFAGPTYLDIFKSRLRIGTFWKEDMPNHAFLAVLTESQVISGVGKQWMAILKEHGFEFLRCVDNSVYTGAKIISKPGKGSMSSHKNYVFGLFRNIGTGAVKDVYEAPPGWAALPDPYEGDTSNDGLQRAQLTLWDDLGPAKLLTEAEVTAAGAPVTLSGRRMPNAAPELKSVREARENTKKKADPFASKAALGVSPTSEAA